MKNKVVKSLIGPLQKVLMTRKLCPACTRNLGRAKLLGKLGKDDVVTCMCGRTFVRELETDTYRRALNEELKDLS